MKKAIVLLSGGIDSVTTLAVAQNEGIEIYAISYNYGQKHGIELNFAKKSAERFHVKKHLVMNFDLRAIGGSALTSDMEVPKRVTSYELRVVSKDQKQDSALNSSLLTPHSSLIPVTYVPARNTIFLSFALAFAESIGAEDIFIGANAVDYSGYPDCRPEFINAFERMANLATKASVEGTMKFRIHAPLISLTKGKIIKKGSESGVDFSLTWSCYDPQKSQMDDGRKTTDEGDRKTGISSLVPHPSSFGFVPCMRCDSCLLRAKGFQDAGIKDPLIMNRLS